MDVNVRDYGAIGNDVHDDSVAFKNAMRAVELSGEGGTIFVPYGTYKIGPSGINGANNAPPSMNSNMHLVGQHDDATQSDPLLHVHSVLTNVLCLCRGDKWSIEHIRTDCGNSYQSHQGRQAVIWAMPGHGWKIENCAFLNNGHRAIGVGGDNWFINNNVMTTAYSVGLGAHPPREGILITAGADIPGESKVPKYGRIWNNYMLGGGIGGMGHHHWIRHNFIYQAGVGTGIFLQNNPTLGIAGYHTVTHNECAFGPEGVDDYQAGHFFQVSGMEIWTPYTLIAFNYAHDNCGGGFALGGRSNVIAFNRAIDNGIDSGNPSHQHAQGFNCRTLTGTNNQNVNNSNSIWIGNTAHDTKAAALKQQDYGVVVQRDNIRCVSFIGNNFHGNKLGEGLYRNCQPNVSTQKGRDMYDNNVDSKQHEILRALFDPTLYALGDSQYVMLNQIMFGSSNARE